MCTRSQNIKLTERVQVLASERWASTISHNREKIFALMLTVCLDAAGKETEQGHRVVVVAGFCGFIKVWDDFDKAWGARIASEPGLTWFHAVNFAHSTGEFSDGWKGDEPRRRGLTKDLMDIVHANGLRKIGCIVHLDDFRSICIPAQQQSGSSVIDAYSYAATKAIDQFHVHARQIGVAGDLGYVVAKGDGEEHLRRVFTENDLEAPDFRSPFPYTDRKGFYHDPFFGLQAADWVAYEYFLDANRRYGGQFNSRWVLDNFDRMPGSIQIAQS